VARALANEAPGDAALDCATLEQLAALGYVDEETLVGRCHPAGSPVDREERESHP
jgi:hypothetical protein